MQRTGGGSHGAFEPVDHRVSQPRVVSALAALVLGGVPAGAASPTPVQPGVDRGNPSSWILQFPDVGSTTTPWAIMNPMTGAMPFGIAHNKVVQGDDSRIAHALQSTGGTMTGPLASPLVTSPGSALVPTSQYNANGSAHTRVLHTSGTAATPDTDSSAVAIFQKTSNYGTAGLNTTLYASHTKLSTQGGNTALGMVGEAIDVAGGTQSSVIGVAGHAQLSSGSYGSATGLAGTATVVASTINFAFGAELSVENLAKDAPALFNTATFVGPLLLDADGTKIADAAAVTNPYSPARFRVGYWVPWPARPLCPACGPAMGTGARW